MRELDLKDIAAVSNTLEELMQEKGLNTGGTGLAGDASINARYNEDGIRISPAMLSGKGFKPGDQFRFRIEGNSIILEKGINKRSIPAKEGTFNENCNQRYGAHRAGSVQDYPGTF